MIALMLCLLLIERESAGQPLARCPGVHLCDKGTVTRGRGRVIGSRGTRARDSPSDRSPTDRSTMPTCPLISQRDSPSDRPDQSTCPGDRSVDLHNSNFKEEGNDTISKNHETKSKWLNVNCFTAGETGPPLILLHGGGVDSPSYHGVK